MRIKVLAGTLLSVFVLVMVTLVAVAPTQRVALVGPVIFEHDDEKMARGEPCTTVYYVNRDTGLRGEKVVALRPSRGTAGRQIRGHPFTQVSLGTERLLEYQFAGQSEGHGVPMWPDHERAK